jgi:C-terminal processing protease CtpA/Prc
MGDQGPNSLRFSGGDAHGQVREESNLVGVGIVFQPVEDGTLYVKRMREDSPAARSGLIQIGDCLCEVNGRCARPPVVLCSARAVPSFPVAR